MQQQHAALQLVTDAGRVGPCFFDSSEDCRRGHLTHTAGLKQIRAGAATNAASILGVPDVPASELVAFDGKHLAAPPALRFTQARNRDQVTRVATATRTL